MVQKNRSKRLRIWFARCALFLRTPVPIGRCLVDLLRLVRASLAAVFYGPTVIGRRFMQFFLRSVGTTRYMMHGFVIVLALAISISGVLGQGEIGHASADGLNDNVVAFGAQMDLSQYAAIYDDGYLEKSNIVSTDAKLRRPEGVIEYTVQGGDSLSTIASRFGVSIKTVQWANQLTDVNRLKPGMILTILPVSGVLYKAGDGETLESIAGKYGVTAADVVAANDLVTPVRLIKDQELVVPIGDKQIPNMPEPEKPKVVASTTKTSSSSRTLSTASAAGSGNVGNGSFGWPSSGKITKNFFQHARGDGAIDIANRSVPPVYAADSGVVIVAGWDRTGYGNRVDIDHGNGFVTRYAHLNAIYVDAGQEMSKGQVLGQMGCTGRCSGTHLHFMIILNGTPQNPLDYL
jgi:murein DD-endopeptidase MepM/ murein hydrolase activator NlpD